MSMISTSTAQKSFFFANARSCAMLRTSTHRRPARNLSLMAASANEKRRARAELSSPSSSGARI